MWPIKMCVDEKHLRCQMVYNLLKDLWASEIDKNIFTADGNQVLGNGTSIIYSFVGIAIYPLRTTWLTSNASEAILTLKEESSNLTTQ